MPIIICIKEWIAEDFCKYVKCLKLPYGGFRHFLKEFFAYDNFREQMTSILCYLVGVIVLCAFFRVICIVRGYRLGWPES